MNKVFSKALMLGAFSAATVLNFSAYAATPSYSENVGIYAEKIPGIGLISDSINFDGITISNFRFDNGKKHIHVKPGHDFTIHFDYAIDASKLKTLHLHHLIVGLHDAGPQKCVLHSLGIRDAKGKATLSLKAPTSKDVYQIRFSHSEGLTDEQAQEAWKKGDGPSAKTIMGIVVVK